MLVSGKWRQEMTVGTFILERPGDYIVWGPGIEHTWQAGKQKPTALYSRSAGHRINRSSCSKSD